jgi:hypothetical protein
MILILDILKQKIKFYSTKKRIYEHISLLYPCRQGWRWGEEVLWLQNSEEKVKSNYERKKIPDPLNFHVKDI